VAHPRWEAGGKHWQDVFGRIYISMILYQALFIGVFGLYPEKKGKKKENKMKVTKKEEKRKNKGKKNKMNRVIRS
jgi:hypothetical protein